MSIFSTPSTSSARRKLLLLSISRQNLRYFSKKRGSFIEKQNPLNIRTPPSNPAPLPFFKPARAENMTAVKQKLDFLLVLDFEATCDNDNSTLPCMEIIEFPVVKLSTKDWQEKGRFHQYVRPTVTPILTSFFALEMVDGKPTIEEVFPMFDKWLKEDQELKNGNFSFLTFGDWDLKVALPNEARFKKFEIPSYFNSWINIKRSFATHTGRFPKGLPDVLNAYKLQLQGHHHSGIDDVLNICEVVKCMGQEGFVFQKKRRPSNKKRAGPNRPTI
ncbi:unnamed protein product [Caenorhabditis auriculariae]|uniref:Exonuclease domain-containing protein n=1 Tax=Caenorhabditis auriculariae TaxID=2777116 RepID=A0A8S1HHK3_9PELO|nr:unnamed protein product [Caenorhabditis auriculariae]